MVGVVCCLWLRCLLLWLRVVRCWFWFAVAGVVAIVYCCLLFVGAVVMCCLWFAVSKCLLAVARCSLFVVLSLICVVSLFMLLVFGIRCSLLCAICYWLLKV